MARRHIGRGSLFWSLHLPIFDGPAGNQSLADGDAAGLLARGDPQLAQDGRDVVIDGLGGDVQPRPDACIRQRPGEQRHDLELACGQAVGVLAGARPRAARDTSHAFGAKALSEALQVGLGAKPIEGLDRGQARRLVTVGQGARLLVGAAETLPCRRCRVWVPLASSSASSRAAVAPGSPRRARSRPSATSAMIRLMAATWALTSVREVSPASAQRPWYRRVSASHESM